MGNCFFFQSNVGFHTTPKQVKISIVVLPLPLLKQKVNYQYISRVRENIPHTLRPTAQDIVAICWAKTNLKDDMCGRKILIRNSFHIGIGACAVCWRQRSLVTSQQHCDIRFFSSHFCICFYISIKYSLWIEMTIRKINLIEIYFTITIADPLECLDKKQASSYISLLSNRQMWPWNEFVA